MCEIEITKEMIKNFKFETKKVVEEKYVPNVIEPSFGIGRLLYCLLEHNFRIRDDEKRTFFDFRPNVAPYKVIFLPLMPKPQLLSYVEELEVMCRQKGIMCKSDTSTNAIGKRYARTDEMGIPFAVTIDYQTVEDQTVTLREILTLK